MKLFMTSSPSGQYMEERKSPQPLNNDNNFVDNIKKIWKENSNGLLIAAFPNEFDMNDQMKAGLEKSFELSGLSVKEMNICDRRNFAEAEKLISNADFIILSGGHVPTENKFFKEIGLKEKIKNFEGIVIGISAGTMNCAERVYAQPEEDGESTDKNYKKFISGLGLTNINVIPHYQVTKNFTIDGQRLFEDVTYKDSIGEKFYALVDGSYIYSEKGKETLFGEAYLIAEGKTEKICSKGEKIIL